MRVINMKPLLVVALGLILSIDALPENIEDVKELPQAKEVQLEAEESQPQVRSERCTDCAINFDANGEPLAAFKTLPGAIVHTQEFIEECSSANGCAGLKIKDGRVVQRFGDLNAFNAASAADFANEFIFQAANIAESGEVPFWWMNKDSPFKASGGGGFDKLNKASYTSANVGSAGLGSAGLGVSGLGAAGIGNTAFGATGITSAGFGNAGYGSAGIGASGLGAGGLGSTRLGGAGYGLAGAGGSGLGVGSIGNIGYGSPGIGATGLGTGGLGSTRVGGIGYGLSSVGASGLGFEGVGNTGFGSAGVGTTGLGSGVIGNTRLGSATSGNSGFGATGLGGSRLGGAAIGTTGLGTGSDTGAGPGYGANSGFAGAAGYGAGFISGSALSGSSLNLAGNPFLNGGVPKYAGATTNLGVAGRPSSLPATSYKSSFGNSVNLAKNPFLNGANIGQAQGGYNALSGTNSQNFASTAGSKFSGLAGSSAGSNVNLIQTQQRNEFDFDQQQQTQQNIGSFGIDGVSVGGGDLQQTCSGEGYACVIRSQCINGVVSGTGLLQASIKKQYCNLRTEVCCRIQVAFNSQDTFTSGSAQSGIYRPVLKPGIPYLPPDNSDTSTNIVTSTVLPRPIIVSTPRPFPSAGPPYLPPVSSTSAPGYLPPIGEQSINRETIVPKPNYIDGSLILDETRLPNRPKIPIPVGPVVTEIPAGCAAALKCTPIEFCTADGIISNTSINLSPEQNAYRVPLTDCRDLVSGRIGKCCRDPYYTDPWPTNQLGKWVPGVFGGNDGKYVPDSRGSGSNSPGVTARPFSTGGVILNEFIKPTTPIYQGTKGGSGQFTKGGSGQFTKGGSGQFTKGGTGQYGISGQGQTIVPGQFIKQGQGEITRPGLGVLVTPGGQGQVISQGVGTGVSQGFGQGFSNGGGSIVKQGGGQTIIPGIGSGISQGFGQGVNTGGGAIIAPVEGQGLLQGTGTGVSQGFGQGIVTGGGSIIRQGEGQGVLQGTGSAVSQGFGQGVLTGGGQGIIQGGGSLVSQGEGLGVSTGFGQGVSNGFGQGVSTGFGQGVSQGFGQGFSQGFGQGVSQGFGQGVIQGSGQGVTSGSGQGVISGLGEGVTTGFGQGVIQGQGSLVSQGQGFDISQGFGEGVGLGEGSLVSQGEGLGIIQGQGGAIQQGFGQGVLQGQGAYVTTGQGQGVSQGFGQGISQGTGSYLSGGTGTIIRQGQGQAVSQGFGTGIRQSQGYTLAENEYSESKVHRVSLKPYNAGQQCGLLNGQRPSGNHNKQEVDFAEIPWQAMILEKTNKSLLCGGVITRPDVVITSAACVDGLDADNVMIKGGEWKLGVDEEPLPFQIVQVKTILVHPSYKPGTYHFDVAILVLTESLRFAKNIYPICLPSAQDDFEALYNGAGECIVTGWGKEILQSHLLGSIMHSLNVSLITPNECQSKISQDYPHLLEYYDQDSCVCAQPTNPLNNICSVDIGSALACTSGNGHYVLRGVYSWDSGCRQIGNQIGSFYKFDIEWYEWALGLIESVRFTQYTTGTIITSGKRQFQIGGEGLTIKQGSGHITNQGQAFDINSLLKPVTNTITYSEKIIKTEPKIYTYTTKPEIITYTTKPEIITYTTKPKIISYTTKPEIITYTTKPEIVTYTTKPEYFTYTTKPKIVTYTTKPQIVTYTTKPKIVTYTTKPQFITYETSGSGTDPQYVAPGLSFKPSFVDLLKPHKHSSSCQCEGKK